MTFAYVHPVLGGGVLLLLAYAASLGLRLRTRQRDRERIAAPHARLAAAAYWLILASWLSGVVSTVWWRDDLELAESLHFRLGTVIALLQSGSALTARWMDRAYPQLRDLHPWLGVAAVLLAAAHAVAGLRITP